MCGVSPYKPVANIQFVRYTTKAVFYFPKTDKTNKSPMLHLS
ncbi:hypothetical protein [Moraxella lacunata]